MKPYLGLTGIIGGCAATVLFSQAAIAASTAITSVEVNPTDSGLEIVLETSNGDRPQIFTVSRGNSLVADIVNTELVLPGGNGYLENDPTPGVSSIALTQLDANSVRLTITGTNEAPAGRVNQDNGLIVFTLGSGGSAANANDAPPLLPDPVFEDDVEISQAPPPSNDDVLITDPDVRIEGQRISPQNIRPAVPPTLPRAVPPPVGDISMTSIDPSPSSIELGTRELVPRLVLRDAPVREVLALLARAAGLNLAYTGLEEGEDGETQSDVLISLDIENEPIEDVFNYVLRLSGVQASRFGRTIFAGPTLPNSARDVVVQNIRLNQVDVGPALNFLVGLGAETAVSRERQVTIVDAVPISQETNITQTQTTTEERIETQRVDYEDSVPILRGLQVVGDERTNSITLIGNPRLVQIAISQLVPLDIRRRQVAVNVRVIDVDLNAVDRASTSFSFGVGNSRIVNTNGVGLINFDTESPAGVRIGPGAVGDGIVGDIAGDIIQPSRSALSFGNDFLAQLQLAVTNGNGKILTDPTLVVQEGQTAEVRLTQDVITNVSVESETDDGVLTQQVDFETEPAGVILSVQVDRIDDNGFVSLSVAPTVSSPGDIQELTVLGETVNLTLIAERRLTSGQVRIRDGQTLILSGIIQEEDRVSITKIPILGDIPLLGALFRSTSRTNERREIVVVMTTNILNDSEFSTYGYSYNGLSQDSQELLRR